MSMTTRTIVTWLVQLLTASMPSIQILEAANGLEAIDVLKEAYLDDKLPSLIILDFNMPMMNGMETYKEIRKYPHFFFHSRCSFNNVSEQKGR